MASRKTAARRPAAGRVTARPGNASVNDRIIDAGFAEAAAVGWTNVTMDGVAARADIALGEVLMFASCRAQLAGHFLKRLDARTLATVKGVDPADSPRDRLFDILMRRFDLLARDRDGVRAMMSGLWRDPPSAAAVACRIDRSAAMMLGAAGISPDGLRGFARVQGLKAVVAYALRAWINDDTADMAKTMAALDRALNRAERLTNLSPLRRRRAAQEA